MAMKISLEDNSFISINNVNFYLKIKYLRLACLKCYLLMPLVTRIKDYDAINQVFIDFCHE